MDRKGIRMTQTEWIISLDDDLKDHDELFVGNVRDGDRLVRCKHCYFYIDGYCDNNVIYQMMSGDLIGVHFEPHEDFYCAMAERKEEQ